MHGYSYHVTLFVRAHIVRSFCVKHCADCYLIKPQMQNMDVNVNESVFTLLKVGVRNAPK